ncbi:ribokinase [Jeotgalibacillus malaysiensis]|uniref:ribokinase n=1 Tax=Jeotgalibacillus malaysiensis TaxID=1508404 RepID=UPI00384C1CE1
MTEIVVVGSINMDIVTTSDRYPKQGETAFGNDLILSSGGKGANQAAACAKLGKSVKLIGAVGKDLFAEQLLGSLKETGVDVTTVKQSNLYPTGCVIVTLDSEAENTMLVIKGANEDLQPEEVQEKMKTLTNTKVCLVQMEIASETVIEAMKSARKQNMFVLLDPAPSDGVVDEVFQYADLITPNEQEAYEITGIKVTDQKSAVEAAKWFHQYHQIKNSIIKLGSRGAVVYEDGHTTFIHPIRVKAVDTVGAGDSFAGALACAIADGETLIDAARYASIVAALKVTKKGAQTGLPTEAEVAQFQHSFIGKGD